MVELGLPTGTMPSINKKVILQFVVGAVVGYIINELISFIVGNPEVKKTIDLTQPLGGTQLRGDDVIQWFAWIIIALKYHAFGTGGFVGCLIGSFTDFFGINKVAA